MTQRIISVTNTVSRRVRFCAAHRLVGYKGACANLHGHNYEVTVEAVGPLDELGMVADFKVLGGRLSKWLNEHWDHKTLVWRGDEALVAALAALSAPFFTMPAQTTAENLAAYLFSVCESLFEGAPFKVSAVHVRETENCDAEHRVEEVGG